MASIFNPDSWTGRAAVRPGTERKEHARAVIPAAATVAVLERPEPINISTPYVPPVAKQPEPEPIYTPIKYDPKPASLKAFSPAQIKEYADLAATVGVAPPDLIVEEFKTWLTASGMTVFALDTVVAFMDQKSKAEGQGWGWHWVPLREKDRVNVHFGQAAFRARRTSSGVWFDDDGLSTDGTPASDHYHPFNARGDAPTAIYRNVVPLHALKKIARIEAEFRHPVVFMVSDYAPAPAFKADPFLMVVVPNALVRQGEGRFVIDVWDEPGFGIEQMLKSGL